MTEFAVGAASLSLLLLGALALAGYQEIDRRSTLGARQSAWQESWAAGSAAGESGAHSLHGRMLADAGALDPMGRKLLVAEQDIAVQASRRSPEGMAGGVAEVMLRPLRAVSGFLGSGFDLAEAGLVLGEVSTSVAPLTGLPAPFDTLELQLQAPFALLGDAWNAGGVVHVRERAAGLVPASKLTALNQIWRPLRVPMSLLEPSLGQLCLGLIEPDRVPEDRLGPGRSPRSADCP